MFGVTALRVLAVVAAAAVVLVAGAEEPLPDRELWTWGSNDSGQSGQGVAATTATVDPAAVDLTAVTMVSAGVQHTLAVQADNSVFSWGSSVDGRTCLGVSTGVAISPQPITGLSGTVHAVAAGNAFTIISTSTNTYSCGAAGAWTGGAGASDVPAVITTPLAPFSAVSAGRNFVVAISDATKEVVTWGQNAEGQLGRSGAADSTPTLVPGLSGTYIAVAAGDDFAYALSEDGRLMAWGAFAQGQTPDPGANPQYQPRLVATEATSVAAGDCHVLWTKGDGGVFARGCGDDHRTGQATEADLTVPSQVNAFTGRAAAVAAGSDFSLIVNDVGLVFSFGANAAKQLGRAGEQDAVVRVPALDFRVNTERFAETTGGGFASVAMAECPCVYGECSDNGESCDCSFTYQGRYCSEEKDLLDIIKSIAVLAGLALAAMAATVMVVFMVFVLGARLAMPKKRKSQFHDVLFSDDKALVGKRKSKRASGVSAAEAGAFEDETEEEDQVENDGHTIYDWFEGLLVSQPALALVLFSIKVEFNADIFARNLVYIYESNNKTINLAKALMLRDIRSAKSAAEVLTPSSPASKVLQQYSRIMGIGFAVQCTSYLVNEIKNGRVKLPGKGDGEGKDLAVSLTSFMRTVGDSIDDMPAQMRQICNILNKKTENKFKQAGALRCIGTYVFSRFLCNALMHPEEYGMSDEVWSREQQVLVKVINRTVTATFTGARFTVGKDPGAAALNQWIEDRQTMMEGFLTLAASLPNIGGGGRNSRSSIRSSIAALSVRGWVQPTAVSIPFLQLVNALEQTYLHLYKNRVEVNGMLTNGKKTYGTPNDLQMQLNTVINKIGRPEGMSTFSVLSV